MNLVTQIFTIAASALTIALVIALMRRGRLRERHAIWWLLAGTLALVISIFPGILAAAAIALGVSVEANLVFFASIAILVLVCIQHSSELTRLEGEVRSLSEQIAMLDLDRRLAAAEAAAPEQSGDRDGYDHR